MNITSSSKHKLLVIIIMCCVIGAFSFIISRSIENTKTTSKGKAAEQLCWVALSKTALNEYTYLNDVSDQIIGPNNQQCKIAYGASCDVNEDGRYQGVTKEGNIAQAKNYDTEALSCVVCDDRSGSSGYRSAYFYEGPFYGQIKDMTIVVGPSGMKKNVYIICPNTTPSPTPTNNLSSECKTCDINKDGNYNALDKGIFIRCIPEYSHCPATDVDGDDLITQEDVYAAQRCSSDMTSYDGCEDINFNGIGTVEKEELDLIPKCIMGKDNPCSTLLDPSPDLRLNTDDIDFCDNTCQQNTSDIQPVPQISALSLQMVTQNPDPYLGKTIRVLARANIAPNFCTRSFDNNAWYLDACSTTDIFGNKFRGTMFLTNPNVVNSRNDILKVADNGGGEINCPLKKDGSLYCGIYQNGGVYVFEGILRTTNTSYPYVDESGVVSFSKTEPVLTIADYCGSQNSNTSYQNGNFDNNGAPYFCNVGEITPTPLFTQTPTPTKIIAPSTPHACTADAKVCPDGSYVSRTGPNCEFAPCPTSFLQPTQEPKPTLNENQQTRRRRKADVNRSGKHDIVDFELVRRALGETNTDLDINDDGKVNALDVAQLIIFIKEAFQTN